MNIGDIKSDVYLLAGATSATYLNADLIRNVNVAYQDVARIIWESAGGWQYDDTNATTLPIAKATMVHNQQDYELPSTAQKVHRVEVKDGSGNWLKLDPLDIHDMSVAAPELLGGSAGTPVYYDLIGRSIMLYPTPHSASVTLASGLAVYVDRDVTNFATTATTSTPGFATQFHRLLSYAAVLDFVQDPTQRNFFIQQRDRMEKGLTRFYGKRAPELKSRVKPAGKKNWRQYT